LNTYSIQGPDGLIRIGNKAKRPKLEKEQTMSKLSRRIVNLKLTYAELSDLYSGLLYSKNSFVSDRRRKEKTLDKVGKILSEKQSEYFKEEGIL
tara:strand:- start:3149 stop:3430 length:282 start_codon:yes stop_codon:yes gene_type:complete